jgi:hypothetical protein
MANFRRLIRLTILIGFSVSLVVTAQKTPEPQGGGAAAATADTASDLPARGKQLRAEIDRAFEKLSEAHAIKNKNQGRNVITDVVLKHIPIGTPFETAQAILRSAGFTLSPHRPNPFLAEGDPLKYTVLATIDHYASAYSGKTSVEVQIFLPSPSDSSAVQKLTAEIIRTFS